MGNQRLRAVWNPWRRCSLEQRDRCQGRVAILCSPELPEERVASGNDWGIQGKGYYTTQKTSAGSQFATITYRGAAFAADDLHSYQTGEDALANIRSQLAADMNRKLQEKLQAQLTGLFGGALSEANVYTYAGNMDAQAVTGARYCLGHKSQTVTTMVVHPCVAHDLEILGMQTFKSDSGAAGGVSYASNGIGVTDTAIRTCRSWRRLSTTPCRSMMTAISSATCSPLALCVLVLSLACRLNKKGTS